MLRLTLVCITATILACINRNVRQEIDEIRWYEHTVTALKGCGIILDSLYSYQSGNKEDSAVPEWLIYHGDTIRSFEDVLRRRLFVRDTIAQIIKFFNIDSEILIQEIYSGRTVTATAISNDYSLGMRIALELNLPNDEIRSTTISNIGNLQDRVQTMISGTCALNDSCAINFYGFPEFIVLYTWIGSRNDDYFYVTIGSLNMN